METNKPQFGTWQPTFYERLFCVISIVEVGKNSFLVIPSEAVFANFEEADRHFASLCKMANKYSQRMSYGLVAELSFRRTWKMKPEYWDQKTQSEFGEIRMTLFKNMVFDFAKEAWSMVITPMRDKHGDQLLAGMPVLNERIEKDTEAFMMYSDWPVTEEAKEAGIYEVVEIWRVDVPALKVKHKKAVHKKASKK